MASLCQYTADYFVNPKVIEFWHTRGKQWGPLLAGLCTASPALLASLPAASAVGVSSGAMQLACNPSHATRSPSTTGALFGAAWWFWADAVALSPSKIPAAHYLPGIIATLALIMINFIRKDELTDIDPFDDASYCRSVVVQ